MAAVASFEAGVHSNAAGAALSVRSEAAFSGSVDVPADSQAQSYGGNSPMAARSQISTALSFEGARPAASTAFAARSGGQESAFSAAAEGEGEHSSMLLRPADSRRTPRQRQRGHGSTSLLSTAMRSTTSRQRRQPSGNLHRATSVASQSTWPHDADANTQAARPPASVYGQLTLPQPQISASPAASTEGNAQGSVAGNVHAEAQNRRVHAGDETGAGPFLEQAEQMEPSLNGPLASLAGRSYSDAGADQDISSPKRQAAVSSAQHRAEHHDHGQGHGIQGRSQLGTWHRQPSQPDPPCSTMLGSMLPELEQSDARQQRLSLTENANHMYSSQPQLTVQQDTPAVSSDPFEPSSMSVPDVPQQLAPAASSDAMQQGSADSQHLRALQADAATQAPDQPGASALRFNACLEPSSLHVAFGHASRTLASRASGTPRMHQTPSAEALAAARQSTDTSSGELPQLSAAHVGPQPDQRTCAAPFISPDARSQAEPSAVPTAENGRQTPSVRSLQAGAGHPTRSMTLGKRSRDQGHPHGTPHAGLSSAGAPSDRHTGSQRSVRAGRDGVLQLVEAAQPHAWAQPFPSSGGPALLNRRQGSESRD
ncbi:hypothetical protein WJX74_007904 [Apatococcus lobatus]|uniref:Uncharacterized protein n=1 Tax=Apatococcus lobatus TaxID=904363 RepID=A0AAW1PUQ2_9CHLO